MGRWVIHIRKSLHGNVDLLLLWKIQNRKVAALVPQGRRHAVRSYNEADDGTGAPVGSKMNKVAAAEDQTVVADAVDKKKFRITIEPLGFVIITSLIILSLATPNLFLYKVCRVNFNMSEKLCDTKNQTSHAAGLENRTWLIDSVQSYVTSLDIYIALINNVPSIFFVLFLGPWSDKHGRKPLMIVPIIGHILSILIYILNYYMDSWPAEYLLWANVPIGVLGGHVALLMAIQRYAMDVTDESNRTGRLALMTGFSGLAVPIALLAGSFIYEYGGPIASWATSSGLLALSLFYVIFILKESVIKEKELKKDSWLGEDRCIPSDVVRNLWQCFAVTLKPRPGYQRASTLLLLVAVFIGQFIKEPYGILYLYTRKKFDWDSPDFARFAVINTTVGVLGTLIILPILSSVLKWKDGTIGILALSGDIGSMFTIAFATYPLMMYLAALGNVLAAGVEITIASIISKIIGEKDLTSVYSVFACVVAIEPLLSKPFFNLIYQATLTYFPGCVFLVKACMLILLLICFVTAVALQGKK